MNFTVGDRVKIVDSAGMYASNVSKEAVVDKISTWNSGRVKVYVKFADGNVDYGLDTDVQLIESSDSQKGFMSNLKETFALAFKAEPEKSFRKAGITNGDDFLTDDGQKIYLSWLLKQNGADFKKEVVDPILEQMDKETK